MVELSTESYVRGHRLYKRTWDIARYICICTPTTHLYGRYTGKYRRVLRSSSGSKKKFSGWFTVFVPKRHDHHCRFDSRALLARILDSCLDLFLSSARFNDLAEFNSSPNFLAIRYIAVTCRKTCKVYNAGSSVQLGHWIYSNIRIIMSAETE